MPTEKKKVGTVPGSPAARRKAPVTIMMLGHAENRSPVWPVLSREAQVLWDRVMGTDYPSWAYMLHDDKTTIPEGWEGGGSQCHTTLGAAIREAGVRAADAEGVQSVRPEDDRSVFVLGSGDYRFEW